MPDYDSDKYPSWKWKWNEGKQIDDISSLVNSLIHDKFKEYVVAKIIENNNKTDDKRR